MPLSSLDSRMAELGVLPFMPPSRGRGHSIKYDANEIDTALKNEREMLHARKEKRKARILRPPSREDNIYNMSWREAEQRLTPSTPTQ